LRKVSLDILAWAVGRQTRDQEKRAETRKPVKDGDRGGKLATKTNGKAVASPLLLKSVNPINLTQKIFRPFDVRVNILFHEETRKEKQRPTG